MSQINRFDPRTGNEILCHGKSYFTAYPSLAPRHAPACAAMSRMELEFLESMGFYASAEQTYRLAADGEVRTVEQAGDFAWVSAYVDASGASITFMQTLAGLTTESFAVYGATPVRAHV